ncbi:uncharacterized protein LOC111873969 [Cryptotermes secundus]|uniref:uncharacterized protein LOC111873969 n=1 Tax=Cryptotermes secundus TaxID=105785 RepID=UPI000CD7CB11|nr:uncharacterized protein LOC111873969 [Cryptotermes secundus]
MKKNAYLALTEKIKTIDPQTKKETVLKKINNLRSSFRKERKKVLMAKKSGMSSEDLYVPKLWYYKDLLFLVDQEEALDGFSSLVSDTEDLEETEQEITQKSASPGISAQSSLSNPNAELSISIGPISSYGCSFKRKKNLPASDQILVAVGDRLTHVKSEDRFDFFAKNVAAKLRALGNNEQRVYEEKLINDALFEAELGSLQSIPVLEHAMLLALGQISLRVPSTMIAWVTTREAGQYYPTSLTPAWAIVTVGHERLFLMCVP